MSLNLEETANGNGKANEENIEVETQQTTASKPESTTKKSKKDKKSKKSRDPSTLTPEYIEEQRRLRNLKKEQKRQELLAQGINPDEASTPPNLKFIKRDFVSIPKQDGSSDSFKIKIMTYNVLAQALIRRKLFPTSGTALKWTNRSVVLLDEFKHYDADIVCLQEMDFIQYNSFWKQEFEKIGYSSKYYREEAKNHGVAVAFKKDLFVCKQQSFIRYDREKSGVISPRTVTQNVGLLVYLEFTPQVLQKYSNLSRNGIIIGTTHLFWHPFGTYERSRQTYLVLTKFKEFYHTLSVLQNNDRGFYSFFAGDFNSQPFDTPYLSIAAKPVKYSGRGQTVISCSLSYQFSKNRGVIEEDGDNEDEEGAEGEEEEGGNVEKFGTNQPKDPVPESFTPNQEQLELVNDMEKLHNDLDMRAVSLYSIGYKSIHPENAGFDNERNEPIFSNWAHTWRGLLDYIFVITKWDSQKEDYSQKVDSIEEVSSRDNVKLLKLLKLPMPKDMGPEPSGQPRTGQYPSDHLCLMAEVELN